MNHIRDILGWLRPELDVAQLEANIRFEEDLHFTSLDGLGLVAMVESLCGRTFSWDTKLSTVADLLDYLSAQGVEMEALA